jgi:hypothetical protein
MSVHGTQVTFVNTDVEPISGYTTKYTNNICCEINLFKLVGDATRPSNLQILDDIILSFTTPMNADYATCYQPKYKEYWNQEYQKYQTQARVLDLLQVNDAENDQTKNAFRASNQNFLNLYVKCMTLVVQLINIYFVYSVKFQNPEMILGLKRYFSRLTYMAECLRASFMTEIYFGTGYPGISNLEYSYIQSLFVYNLSSSNSIVSRLPSQNGICFPQVTGWHAGNVSTKYNMIRWWFMDRKLFMAQQHAPYTVPIFVPPLMTDVQQQTLERGTVAYLKGDRDVQTYANVYGVPRTVRLYNFAFDASSNVGFRADIQDQQGKVINTVWFTNKWQYFSTTDFAVSPGQFVNVELLPGFSLVVYSITPHGWRDIRNNHIISYDQINPNKPQRYFVTIRPSAVLRDESAPFWSDRWVQEGDIYYSLYLSAWAKYTEVTPIYTLTAPQKSINNADVWLSSVTSENDMFDNFSNVIDTMGTFIKLNEQENCFYNYMPGDNDPGKLWCSQKDFNLKVGDDNNNNKYYPIGVDFKCTHQLEGSTAPNDPKNSLTMCNKSQLETINQTPNAKTCAISASEPVYACFENNTTIKCQTTGPFENCSEQCFF